MNLAKAYHKYEEKYMSKIYAIIKKKHKLNNEHHSIDGHFPEASPLRWTLYGVYSNDGNAEIPPWQDNQRAVDQL